ncbi:nucleotide-sugar transporter domain-containing protein [Ditylenchus destructor]|uniref:Nucleotide-sugar transporter domain-containing protein n=1 Tax=Ditylenchus destructor TaxID=166010 RepID=A0AAD4MLM9_9BILA|nr:nucleotide-sugar transporter domain-containing protein [Ditylenchus destructor]
MFAITQCWLCTNHHTTFALNVEQVFDSIHYFQAYATSISIVISCVASIYLFGVYPSELFILGALFVIISIVIYGAFPYKSKEATTNTEETEDRSKGKTIC